MNKQKNKRGRTENLRPVKTHEEAVEKGRKGGSRSTVRKRMVNRKNCTLKCPYNDRCPAITTSLAGGGRCIIKTSPKEVQHYFFNLFDRGEEGLVKIALSLYFQFLLKTGKEPTARTLRDAIATTLDLKKGVYGEKAKVELSGKVEGFEIVIGGKKK